MPKITSYNYLGPLAFSDRLIGVFGGVTNGVSLQQFRDFFGVGTNIIPVPFYPPADQQAMPEYGKNNDFILVQETNRLYQKKNNAFPPENQPTAVMQGTKVNDAVVSLETSWSSHKIDEYIRGAVAVAMDLVPGEVKRVPFFSKVLLESLRVSFGPDSFQVRLLLSDGQLITTQAGTGAATIGAVSVSINTLAPAVVAAGYNVEFTNTGNSPLTGVLRTIPTA